jgi:arabinofuranosyltransferase
VSGSIPETGENPRGTSAAGIRLLALTPSLLLAANTSFAYWSISGLETPLFVLGVLTTLYLYFSDTRLAVAAAAATSLVRPEGVLVFAILILHGLLARRCGLRRGLLYIAGYVVLMLPFLAFRLGYYGDLLPNPFYAKTGIGAQYFRSGLEYFLRFLKDYGLWGLPYLVPILLWRRLRSDGRLLLVAACV